MCEMVVQVRDKSANLQAWKAGTVISVGKNGFDWGPAALGKRIEGNPNGRHLDWRVLKFPRIPTDLVEDLLEPVPNLAAMSPSAQSARRKMWLDRSKFTDQALIDYWDDDTRKVPYLSLDYSLGQLMAICSSVED